MLDFYQRRKIKGILILPITRIFLFILVVFLAYSAYTRYQVAADMSERRETAEKAVIELETRKRLLEEEVRYLQDERGIEAELRRQFDVALPGEEVVVITEEATIATTTIEPIEVPRESWYRFWE